MPEIPYNRFQEYLAKTPAADLPQVWLIYGEEAFCNIAADDLVDRLLPGSEKAMGYEPVENDDVFAAIERSGTFSLFSESRVISLPDSRIFYSREDHRNLFKKARQSFEDGQMQTAARHFAAALGMVDLSLDDTAISEPGEQGLGEKGLSMDPELLGNGRWITALAAWCRDHGVSPSQVPDRSGELQAAVAAGFAPRNYLVITTDLVDRRRGLYKIILEKGGIVNCSVPTGAGRQDRSAREALLEGHTRTVLAESGKALDPDAYRLVLEMTGFDLRTLSANLRKLVEFTGNRPAITTADVRQVLNRTRQDPVYELTGAISERNIESALFFMRSLLTEGLFPLQILAAMINAVRRLLTAKGFVIGPGGKAWKSGMHYNDFQRITLPAVQEYDRALLLSLAEWDAGSEVDEKTLAQEKSKPKGRRGSSSHKSDLLIAPKGKNAYPIYLLLKNAERFKLTELIDAMKTLQQADVMLKTSGGQPSLLLESVVMKICLGR